MNKKRTIYTRKDKGNLIEDNFKAVRAENYATLVDSDLSYELSAHLNNIKVRIMNAKTDDKRPEFTVPLYHMILCMKEISYTLNSYIENPPKVPEDWYDPYLIMFRDTVNFITTLQDYLDGKLQYAKQAMVESRGLGSWEDVIGLTEAMLADLACRGNLKYKKETNVEKWRLREEEKKNERRKYNK